MIFHGGGVTGLEQVNDTHLHAQVQRTMEQLETRVQYDQRRQNPGHVPKLSRQDVIDVVREMWLSIDHDSVSRTGYLQTGPTLPPDQGVEALYKDLQPFWDRVNGDAIRQHAIDSVTQMWNDGVITGWHDAETLIEDHVPHPQAEEGLEAVDYNVTDNEDADDDDGDDQGGDGGGGGAGEAAAGDDDDAGEAAAGGEPAGVPGGDAAGAATHSADATGCLPGDELVPWGGVCTEDRYMESIDVMVDVARATRDDVLLRKMLHLRQRSVKKKTVEQTPASIALKAAARADREQEIKRRNEQRTAEHRTAMDAIAAKTALQTAKAEAAESRRLALEAARLAKAEALEKKKLAAKARAHSSWLQEQFPVKLAKDLYQWRRRPVGART